MAKLIHSFADLLKLWAARDLAADLDAKEVTVRAWRQRGIPAEYWLGVVASARKRNIEDITLDLLARLATLQAGREIPKGMAA